MNIFGMLSDLFNSEDYKKNPAPRELTDEQLAGISIGAINSEQTGYYCDSLETGAEIFDIKENLEDYYGITDSASAVDTLDWLLERGHRVYFDAIKGMVSGRGTGVDVSGLEPGEQERVGGYISNLEEASEDLAEEDYINDKSDLADISVTAWDMGRLVLVTRCCFDAGYISENDAWRYINSARISCKEQYGSWKELARGYVIGRAMWSGGDMSLSGIMAIAEGLLDDDESPWKRVKF
ncbi:MAG: DUF1266 domain-containing protein [Oscillospiraceae bacterium]|nr:DUF1266 domain-containing protein [Oscillospiraceae bacterium]